MVQTGGIALRVTSESTRTPMAAQPARNVREARTREGSPLRALTVLQIPSARRKRVSAFCAEATRNRLSQAQSPRTVFATPASAAQTRRGRAPRVRKASSKTPSGAPPVPNAPRESIQKSPEMPLRPRVPTAPPTSTTILKTVIVFHALAIRNRLPRAPPSLIVNVTSASIA